MRAHALIATVLTVATGALALVERDTRYEPVFAAALLVMAVSWTLLLTRPRPPR